MDVLDVIKAMMKGSGTSAAALSRALGKSRTYIGTTMFKGSDVGSGNLAKMAELMDYQVKVVGRGEEFEVTPRGDGDADEDQGPAD